MKVRKRVLHEILTGGQSEHRENSGPHAAFQRPLSWYELQLAANRLKVVKTRRSLQWLIGGRRREMSTTGALILRLSDDLVLHVFSFLRAEMLARVCALSRRMCAIASEDLLWYGLLCEELGHGRLPGPSMSHVVGEWRRRWIAWRRLEVVGCETRSVQGEEEEVPQASHAPSPS